MNFDLQGGDWGHGAQIATPSLQSGDWGPGDWDPKAQRRGPNLLKPLKRYNRCIDAPSHPPLAFCKYCPGRTLRALGLLLVDGALTVGRGKTF